MSVQCVLALDVGACTGWAVRCPSNVVDSGFWQYTRKKLHVPGRKFTTFEKSLHSLLSEHEPHVIVHEMPNMLRSWQANAAQYGYVAIIQAVADRMGIPCFFYMPTAVKKHATGSGNAKKEQMLVAAMARWPEQNIIKHDQADALMVLSLWLAGGQVSENAGPPAS